MPRVMLSCDRCHRQFEADEATVQRVRRAPQEPVFCSRSDCEALAQELERAREEKAGGKKKRQPKFPPELRELTVLEKEIQRAILHYITVRGIFAWRQNQGALHMPEEEGHYGPTRHRWGRKERVIRFAHVDGISDIIGVYRGRFLAIEVKRKGNKPTDDQRAFLERVDKEGGIAIVAYSVDDVVNALKEVDEGKR